MAHFKIAIRIPQDKVAQAKECFLEVRPKPLSKKGLTDEQWMRESFKQSFLEIINTGNQMLQMKKAAGLGAIVEDDT